MKLKIGLLAAVSVSARLATAATAQVDPPEPQASQTRPAAAAPAAAVSEVVVTAQRLNAARFFFYDRV